MALLSANEVHYSYKSKYQTVHAVRGVTYNFESGKFYAIVGKSGCGKTTFLSMLAGLDLPSDGAVEFGGKTTAELIPHGRRGVDMPKLQSFPAADRA